MTIQQFLFEPFRYEFMTRALIASVIVGILCAILSCFLVVKKWALLGDALSHSVLPGVAIAFMLKISLFIGALAAGLLTALGIGVITRNSRIKEDTAMGVMYSTAFALGVLILSLIHARSVDLYHILFGNVLGVSIQDMIITFIIGGIVLSVIFAFYKEFLLQSFDSTIAASIGLPVNLLHYAMILMLTLTIVASLQTVGIILVVAMLIIPGATAFLLFKRMPIMILFAAVIGIFSSITGLYLSYYINAASGPAMVLVSACIFLLAFLFSPKSGAVIKSIRKSKNLRKIKIDDYLALLFRFAEKKQPATIATLIPAAGDKKTTFSKILAILKRDKLVIVSDNDILLTPAGEKRASFIIKAHRLWEKYLTEKGNIHPESVHQIAHRLEHETSRDVVNELSIELHNPKKDPHGKAIPKGQIIRK